MTTLTAVSAVNIAICRSKVDGSAFPGSIQGTSVDVARDCAQTNVTVVGLCNVGASSGRNRLLFGESLIVALRSGSIQSDALYPHNGEGVVCDLDLSAKKKINGSYWGGADAKSTYDCWKPQCGDQAQSFCLAHGFDTSSPDSFIISDPGFPMERSRSTEDRRLVDVGTRKTRSWLEGKC